VAISKNKISAWNPECGWQILRRSTKYQEAAQTFYDSVKNDEEGEPGKFLYDLLRLRQGIDGADIFQKLFGDGSIEGLRKYFAEEMNISLLMGKIIEKEVVKKDKERGEIQIPRPYTLVELVEVALNSNSMENWKGTSFSRILQFPIPPDVAEPNIFALFYLWKLHPARLLFKLVDHIDFRPMDACNLNEILNGKREIAPKKSKGLIEMSFLVNFDLDDQAILGNFEYLLARTLKIVRKEVGKSPFLRKRLNKDELSQALHAWETYDKEKSKNSKFGYSELAKLMFPEQFRNKRFAGREDELRQKVRNYIKAINSIMRELES
jgi:hypothetical protein